MRDCQDEIASYAFSEHVAYLYYHWLLQRQHAQHTKKLQINVLSSKMTPHSIQTEHKLVLCTICLVIIGFTSVEAAFQNFDV